MAPSVLVICRSANGSGVFVNVKVGVGANVGVRVGFGPLGLGVDEEVGGMNISGIVGLDAITNVLVGDVTGMDVAVCITGNVPVAMGNGVPVVNEAPGVRKTLSHEGFVRIAGSIGSMKPPGRRVRKSLFGSRFESKLVSSAQLGEKRSAHPLARRIQKTPNRRMRNMMIQSRLSCSRACIGISV